MSTRIDSSEVIDNLADSIMHISKKLVARLNEFDKSQIHSIEHHFKNLGELLLEKVDLKLSQPEGQELETYRLTTDHAIRNDDSSA